MTYIKYLTLIVILLAGILFLKAKNNEIMLNDKIPSLTEIQKMIGAEPDGIYGPKTKAKWDRAICQQYADEYNYYYEEKK